MVHFGLVSMRLPIDISEWCKELLGNFIQLTNSHLVCIDLERVRTYTSACIHTCIHAYMWHLIFSRLGLFESSQSDTSSMENLFSGSPVVKRIKSWRLDVRVAGSVAPSVSRRPLNDSSHFSGTVVQKFYTK